MTNDAWHLSISSSSDPGCCICHLDRNCSIKTPLYSTPLTASFCCRVKKWLIPPPLHLTRNVWKWFGGLLGPRIFPPLFRALSDRKSSLGTHFAANLTICLLARSPTATRACTLNCCWRRTKKHCFPENKTSTIHHEGAVYILLSKLNTHDIWKAQTLFLRRRTLGVCECVTLVIYR